MIKFKIGMRVKCVRKEDLISAGMKGVVVDLPPNDRWIGVAWEGFKYGHNCDGQCNPGEGFPGYVTEDCIQPLFPNWKEILGTR